MTERQEQELELLVAAYPPLEMRDEGGQLWCRLPSYPVSGNAFTRREVEVAFRIPSQAGEQPYGFWVRPTLDLAAGGTINNYSYPAATPWGPDWGQFSWSPLTWAPKADLRAGSNMVNFVRSFNDRLNEGA